MYCSTCSGSISPGTSWLPAIKKSNTSPDLPQTKVFIEQNMNIDSLHHVRSNHQVRSGQNLTGQVRSGQITDSRKFRDRSLSHLKVHPEFNELSKITRGSVETKVDFWVGIKSHGQCVFLWLRPDFFCYAKQASLPDESPSSIVPLQPYEIRQNSIAGKALWSSNIHHAVKN